MISKVVQTWERTVIIYKADPLFLMGRTIRIYEADLMVYAVILRFYLCHPRETINTIVISWVISWVLIFDFLGQGVHC